MSRLRLWRLDHFGAGFRDAAPLILAAPALAVIFEIYLLGAGFGFSFDDVANLRTLDSVVDFESALLFLFGGTAGPLGRPVSMAAFLLDLRHWPGRPEGFIFTNALLHQLNTLLVAWFAYLLAPLARIPAPKRGLFAVLAAIFWGSSPILLSSSLMIVQRMNLLAATCVLAGLITFLKGMDLSRYRPTAGLGLMCLGAWGWACLGALAKENAVLLPVLALCVDRCLLRQPSHPVLPDWWRTIFLRLPLVLIVGYLARYWWTTGGTYPGRDFDVLDRLISESRILFQYARMILLPHRSGLGPYHDGYLASDGLFSPASGFFAVLVWLVAVSLAMRAASAKARLAALAVLWFLSGHLLESTVVGLELYFEHRNYIPSVGIWLLVSALLVSGAVPRHVRILGGAAILAIQYAVLLETARLWAEPATAAAVWAIENPQSHRALMLYSAELARQGRLGDMTAAIDRVQPPLATRPDFLAHKLDVYCRLKSDDDVRHALSRFRDSLGERPAGHFSGIFFSAIAGLVKRGECSGVTRQELRMLAEVFVTPNPRFSPELRGFGHNFLLDFWIKERRLEPAIYHADKLFRITRDLGVAELMIEMLMSAGRYQEARDLIPTVLTLAPKRPVVVSYWRERLEKLDDLAARAQALPETAPR